MHRHRGRHGRGQPPQQAAEVVNPGHLFLRTHDVPGHRKGVLAIDHTDHQGHQVILFAGALWARIHGQHQRLLRHFSPARGHPPAAHAPAPGGPRRHLNLPAPSARDPHRSPSTSRPPRSSAPRGPPHRHFRPTGPFCPHTAADSRPRRPWPCHTRGGPTDPDATTDSHPGNTLVKVWTGGPDPGRLTPLPVGREGLPPGKCAGNQKGEFHNDR